MEEKKYTSGFESPRDYFDSFEDRLFDRLGELNLPKEAGFNVPDGYFDTLDNRILERLDNEKMDSKVIPLFSTKRMLYVAGIAASLLLIVSLFMPDKNTAVDLNDVQLASIEEYINEGGADIDSYDLIALLGEDELVELSLDSDFLKDEDLEEYILENIDDPSLLIE